MIDHTGKVHGEWRRALEWIPKVGKDKQFKMSSLSTETLTPYSGNAAELAAKYEQTIVDLRRERLYKNRVRLAGGADEAGNGFEMWRRLHLNSIGVECCILLAREPNSPRYQITWMDGISYIAK